MVGTDMAGTNKYAEKIVDRGRYLRTGLMRRELLVRMGDIGLLSVRFVIKGS